MAFLTLFLLAFAIRWALQHQVTQPIRQLLGFASVPSFWRIVFFLYLLEWLASTIFSVVVFLLGGLVSGFLTLLLTILWSALLLGLATSGCALFVHPDAAPAVWRVAHELKTLLQVATSEAVARMHCLLPGAPSLRTWGADTQRFVEEARAACFQHALQTRGCIQNLVGGVVGVAGSVCGGFVGVAQHLQREKRRWARERASVLRRRYEEQVGEGVEAAGRGETERAAECFRRAADVLGELAKMGFSAAGEVGGGGVGAGVEGGDESAARDASGPSTRSGVVLGTASERECGSEDHSAPRARSAAGEGSFPRSEDGGDAAGVPPRSEDIHSPRNAEELPAQRPQNSVADSAREVPAELPAEHPQNVACHDLTTTLTHIAETLHGWTERLQQENRNGQSEQSSGVEGDAIPTGVPVFNMASPPGTPVGIATLPPAVVPETRAETAAQDGRGRIMASSEGRTASGGRSRSVPATRFRSGGELFS